MFISLLIGVAIGALVGAVLIGIAECLKCAGEIFDAEPSTNKVEVIKKDSRVFHDVLMKYPCVRRAMRGDPTAIVLQYNKGKITSAGSLSGELSCDFDDCSGYRVTRRNREQAIKI